MNKKRVLAMIMIIVMVMTIIPFGTFTSFANETTETIESDELCPLDVCVKTDKTKYSFISTALFTVTVKNVSSKKIENISAISDFSDVQPISGQLYAENETLDPNESFSYSYTATVKPSKLNFFWKIVLLIKNIISGTKSIPTVNFDDGRTKVSASIDVKYGSVNVTDTVNVWFKSPTEIINAKTSSDFESEVTKIINDQIDAEEFERSSALTEEYYTQRIIVVGKSLNNIDFTKYLPDTIVFNEDNSKAVIQCNSQAVAEACKKELNALSNVDFAEVDTIMTVFGTDLTWGKSYIKADSYEHYLENNNYFNMITVAVVDSGIDMEHSYLKNRITSNGVDLVKRDTVPDDENGHGTHVAGIIANCTEGLNVKILPIKVMDKTGIGSSYIIAQGIKQAANEGADIINLSLGGKRNSIIDKAVDYAINTKGAVVCVAAGNGDEKTHKPLNTADISPACVSDAIVVSALDSSSNIASFSNYGASVDVSAPGVDVYSTYKDGTYAKLSGTSMAAPHISAVAAMFKLANPSYKPAQIEELVKNYCNDLGESGRDDIYGYGSVNMYNAIPDCTVSFNTNGGSLSNNQTVKSTEDITLPKPSKSYTVRLNANGGSVSTATYTLNCKLEGWYKSSSLSGTRYAPDELYMAKTNETLYAKWENPTLGYVNNPTRTYYKFDGWFTAANGGVSITSTSTITGNMTLYAHWTELPVDIPNYNGWDIESAKQSLDSLGVRYTVSTGYNGNYANGKVYEQSVIGNAYRSNTVVNLTYCSGTMHYVYYHRTSYNGKWGSDSSMPNGERHEIDLTYPLSVKYQATYDWYGDYKCEKCCAVHMWLPAGTYIG